MCHTNPKYIEKAKTLSPEVLEQIESGEISIGDIMRAERTEALKAKEKEKASESMVANETSAQEVEITQEPIKVELSDEQILKLVRVARSKVKKLECTLVQREVKMKMKSIFINVAPMEKIKEIQLTLGINLTE
jgi:chorismate-pyruvate lyase